MGGKVFVRCYQIHARLDPTQKPAKKIVLAAQLNLGFLLYFLAFMLACLFVLLIVPLGL